MNNIPRSQTTTYLRDCRHVPGKSQKVCPQLKGNQGVFWSLSLIIPTKGRYALDSENSEIIHQGLKERIDVEASLDVAVAIA